MIEGSQRGLFDLAFCLPSECAARIETGRAGIGIAPPSKPPVRLVNASPLKQNVSIDLAGAGASRYSAIATHLTSKNLDDENSLAEPTRIAPIERQLPGVGSKFQYELEGKSFTILKLTAD